MAALGLLVVYLFVTLSARQRGRETPLPPAKPGAYEVSGTPEPDVALKLQQSYAGWNREPAPAPKVSAAPPPIPIPEPLPALQQAQPAMPLFTQAAAPPLPPAREAPSLLPTSVPPERQAPVQRQEPPAPPKPKRWLFAEMGQHLSKPPFPVAAPSKESPTDAKPEGEKTASSLVHAAQWTRPVDPTRVLYRSQSIHGLVLNTINSDIPGDVKIHVITPVTDRFAQGQVLIPQHAIVIGTQEGKTSFGQARLGIQLEQLEFPDGTIVTLKGKVADKSGAVGAEGTVNNHYGRVILGAGISALLSIGSRAPFGSTEGFQSSLQQDFAKDASGGLNRSGQDILKRELLATPTITIPSGTEVSIQLQENVSFSKEPTLTK
jgi:type IV secretion system protein VirB10